MDENIEASLALVQCLFAVCFHRNALGHSITTTSECIDQGIVRAHNIRGEVKHDVHEYHHLIHRSSHIHKTIYLDNVLPISTMEHSRIDPAILYWGTPVVLVSTSNEDYTPNISPMSSAFWLGDRCILGLASHSQTTVNLLRTKVLKRLLVSEFKDTLLTSFAIGMCAQSSLR